MPRTILLRTMVVIGVLCLLIAAGVVLPGRGESPQDSTTAVGGPGFATISSSNLESNLEILADRLATQPKDAQGWAMLAQGYIEQARLTADPLYYAKAEEAIASSFEAAPDDNYAAYAATAAVSASKHLFNKSLDAAKAALAINPLDVVALAIRTDALTELGRYDDALASAKTMDRLRPGLAATTRLAYQAELRGQNGYAAQLFSRAASHATGNDLAFALVHQANLIRTSGRLSESKSLYQDALRAAPASPTAVAGLARIAAARGDLTTATRLARRVVVDLPLPENVTYLGELLLTQGRRSAAQAQFAVAEASARLAEDQGVKSDLELALFLADHGDPPQALAAGRAAWAQRHSVHTADALGWALHVTGRDDAALPLLRRANDLGMRSAQFLHHLGIVEADLGLTTSATAHLRAALRVDEGYSPWQRDQVERTLKSLANR